MAHIHFSVTDFSTCELRKVSRIRALVGAFSNIVTKNIACSAFKFKL